MMFFRGAYVTSSGFRRTALAALALGIDFLCGNLAGQGVGGHRCYGFGVQP